MKWKPLEVELVRIRTDGYSLCHDESVFGITSIAVPVVDSQCHTIAALAVVFSSYFLTPEFRNNAVKRLKDATKEISTHYAKPN